MDKDIKVLIVGSTPYSKSSQARSFETYLNHWKDKTFLIRQIYSKPIVPSFDYCDEFFQITDKRLIKICHKENRGIVFRKNDSYNKLDLSSGTISNAIRKKKGNFVRMLRAFLWGKKRWLSKKLIKWLDEFNPDIVFLSFGDDLYLFRIAKWISNKNNIPIVTVVSDDWYTPMAISKSPFSAIYRRIYYKELKDLFNNPNNGIAFNSEKILKKYTNEFHIKSYKLVPVSYSTDFKNKHSSLLNTQPDNKLVISYFGNFEFGRYKTILDVADGCHGLNIVINVYGEVKSKKIESLFKEHPNIRYLGFINYEELVKKVITSNYLLIVESLDQKDSTGVKYALSTKVADYLFSGVPIIAVGNSESGAIQYLKENNSAFVCDDKNSLSSFIIDVLNDKTKKEVIVANAKELAKKNHDININGDKFYSLCLEVIEKRG